MMTCDASTLWGLFTFTLLTLLQISTALEIDEAGYIIYCPCMGRFGNQADHLLGSLSFAKKLNRTLVLPPFISHGGSANGYTPFKDLFDLEAVGKFHKSVDMSVFMEEYAPTIWPEEKRTVYCHAASIERSKDGKSCPAKEGSPFGPFWDSFNVDFPISEAFDAGFSYHSQASKWNKMYPVDEHPVLAFVGAPASYPVDEFDRHIQKHIDWTPAINDTVTQFIKKKLKSPFVGIHLRNGRDWVNACKHIPEEGLDYSFMSSPQCTGYPRWNYEYSRRATPRTFTKDMCFPPEEDVKKQVLEAVQEVKAKSLFIATDNEPMVKDFKKLFKKHNLSVKIVRYDSDSVTYDMAVLMEADRFIGTCASSVSAFVARKRTVLGKPNSFFSLFPENSEHDEL